MVGLTHILSRVPVIKFRKGGLVRSAAAPSAPAPASAPAGAAGAAPAAGAPMSTSAISDINLPPRYQRRPLTEEEINTINGGGIV